MNATLKIAGAAATVLVVALAGYRILAPAAPSGPGGQPTPTAAPTATPTPSLMSVPSEGTLVPGTYRLTSIEPLTITFTVPSGPIGWQQNTVPNVIWASNSEARFGFGTVSNLFADPCDTSALREPPIGPSVDDLATVLATLPGLTPVTPAEVVLGGVSGKLVEINLAAGDEPCGEAEVALWEVETIGEAEPLDNGRTRFWILDAGGTRLVVTAVERVGAGPTHRSLLQAIIDSIRIEP